jgi:DNA polymerase III delta prime subunit
VTSLAGIAYKKAQIYAMRKLVDEAEASGITARGLDEIFARATGDRDQQKPVLQAGAANRVGFPHRRQAAFPDRG